MDDNLDLMKTLLPGEISDLVHGKPGTDPDASKWESRKKRRADGKTLDVTDFSDRIMSGEMEVPGGNVFDGAPQTDG